MPRLVTADRLSRKRSRADIDLMVTNADGTEVLKGETTIYQAAPPS